MQNCNYGSFLVAVVIFLFVSSIALFVLFCIERKKNHIYGKIISKFDSIMIACCTKGINTAGLMACMNVVMKKFILAPLRERLTIVDLKACYEHLCGIKEEIDGGRVK
jgi:hypothetical protein